MAPAFRCTGDVNHVQVLASHEERGTGSGVASRQEGGSSGSDEYPPGGPWLYARLHASAERHDELLTQWLLPLFTDLAVGFGDVDRWFFVRYQDPEPHLRLRFHGRPEALYGRLLPRLHDLTDELHAKGLARGLRLDSYLPETQRYGGPLALPLAEEVFCADSRLVLARLRAAGGDPLLNTASDVVELVRAFHAGYGLVWSSWLTETYPKQYPHHQAFVERRRAALARIALERTQDDGQDRESRETAEVLGRVLSLLEAFGRRLRARIDTGDTAADAGAVLASFLHMHCNRRLGIDPKAEARAMAIARGAVQGHLDRQRARS